MKSKAMALMLALLLVPSAWALTLDEARQQGRLGETLSGYVAARQQDDETLALVKRINDGRTQQYQRVAQQNNLTTSEVARIAGEKLVSRAGSGEYVRGINGQWLRK
ncbi:MULTISPECIES: YdbL family protein [unclassified Pantoea]|uniref:YdbL family protein n=1 Tax=unclassified Pantoea TaxID=2630326 RepID=UPI001CD7E6FF|nr:MULTISPECIES: YdbL family protein [unclassified Pantoea]MCA1174838.1 YdbL family protein [Pantoea sp. alder69]MCA1253914.1 YdbL family protein [Pantoea sp. alder70]MCA1264245.1 YdbL family protein [Pantoea sp. alder81]